MSKKNAIVNLDNVNGLVALDDAEMQIVNGGFSFSGIFTTFSNFFKNAKAVYSNFQTTKTSVTNLISSVKNLFVF